MVREFIVETVAESAGRAESPGDAELVAAINQGDHAAFETLYRRHRDWTVNLAFRFTGDEALALDVMQETFLYLLLVEAPDTVTDKGSTVCDSVPEPV